MSEFPPLETICCASEAVFVRTGVIYDPVVQTCIFDPGWSPDSGPDDRRRLRSDEDTSAAVCAAGASEAVAVAQVESAAKHEQLQTELRELKAETQELKAMLRQLLAAK